MRSLIVFFIASFTRTSLNFFDLWIYSFHQIWKFLTIITWNIFSPSPLWELQLLYSRSPKVVPQLNNFLFSLLKKKKKNPFILHDSFWIISVLMSSSSFIFSSVTYVINATSKFYTRNYYIIIWNLIFFPIFHVSDSCETREFTYKNAF